MSVRPRKSATASCVVVLALVAVAASAAGPVALPYPVRPIRIIVTNGPGSGPDVVTRAIGVRLTATWGQQVIVDNRAGANGIIGMEIGARAAPDGYTLMMVTSQAAIVSALYERLTYDLVRDFSPVSLLATTPFGMVVHPSVAASSVPDLVALAKARPGELRYGSTGSGSPSHLATEIFKSMTGIDMLHVPYKAVAPAVTDTVAGHVQLTMQAVPAVLPLVKAKKLRAVGVTSLQRTPLAPEWPTVAETVPGFQVMGWYGLAAPTGTPPAVISSLNAALNEMLKAEDFRERLSTLGAEPLGSTPRRFGEHVLAEVEKFRRAGKAVGVRLDR